MEQIANLSAGNCRLGSSPSPGAAPPDQVLDPVAGLLKEVPVRRPDHPQADDENVHGSLGACLRCHGREPAALRFQTAFIPVSCAPGRVGALAASLEPVQRIVKVIDEEPEAASHGSQADSVETWEWNTMLCVLRSTS